MNYFSIGERKIGREYPPYIIAEISANHNGKIEKALRLIEIAKECGADAVKIQTYTPDTMTLDHPRSDFQITKGPWKGYSLYQLYKEAHTPWDWHQALFNKAKEVGITLFSSPFDKTAVDFLMKFDVPAFKVASFEIVDTPLIEYIAKTKKPILMSTGMASISEIEESLNVIKKYHNNILLFHCVSGYPTPLEQSNLGIITDLSTRFDVCIGLSDHTLGTTASVAGVALGATVIEKHFIESRSDMGPDAQFSLEPSELKSLVSDCQAVWRSIKGSSYQNREAEQENLVFRRSIYFVKNLQAGETISEESIRTIRPGHGLKPKHFYDLIGAKVKTKIEKGTPVSWELIDLNTVKKR